MRPGIIAIAVAAGALAACGGPDDQQNNAAAASPGPAPAAPARSPLSTVPPPLPPATPPLADDEANQAAADGNEANDTNEVAAAPLSDTKSADAAKAIAQRFMDLLNHGELGEAYMLLGSNAPARSDFDAGFSGITNLHATMGTPGDPEGAAGSSYLSVPATLTGQSGGKAVKRPITIVLRRVNDVPGSTAAQRRWHIERVDAG